MVQGQASKQVIASVAMTEPKSKFTSLEDIRLAWQRMDAPMSYKRDYISSLNRLEKHSGRALVDYPLDRQTILEILKDVDPRVCGIALQTWWSIKSRCNKAIEICLSDDPSLASKFHTRTETWECFLQRLKTHDERRLLAPLEKLASSRGLEPRQIDDEAMENFYSDGNWCNRANRDRYRRKRVKVWNLLQARNPELGLRLLSVPPVRYRRRRVRWQDFQPSFYASAQDHCNWAADANPFAPGARKRPLSRRSIIGRLAHIHAAADALVRLGIPIDEIKSVADLLKPDFVKQISALRFQDAGDKHTWHNFQLGRALVELAEWSQLHEDEIAEIRAITRLNRKPPLEMTEKNRRLVLPFEDPNLVALLLKLPEVLFQRARSERGPRDRLAAAHAAIAIGILPYCPFRLENLASLQFGKSVYISPGAAIIRIDGQDVKNKVPLEFDIPDHLIELLRTYREKIVPSTVKSSTDAIFVNVSGKRKTNSSIAALIKRNTARHLGIAINPHAFRHLAAKIVLDRDPGAYPLVQQLLGHRSLNTTTTFYTGRDTKRAGRHLRAILSNARDNARGSSSLGCRHD
jgi:integrase